MLRFALPPPMLRFALAMTAAVATVATPDADAVLSLPGYGTPPSPQFSGFLNASAAEPGTMLHYWFAAAASPDWKNMPVVLWLNGGPGASSLIGMLQEQGPLIIDRAGGLLEVRPPPTHHPPPTAHRLPPTTHHPPPTTHRIRGRGRSSRTSWRWKARQGWATATARR